MDRDFNTVITELTAIIPAYVSGDAEFKMYDLLDELQALYLAMEEVYYPDNCHLD